MTRAKQKKVSAVDAERVQRALQTQTNPIRGLTAQRLVQALEDFKRGGLRDAAVLWQDIRERDDTTIAVTEKRDLDAALLDWEILSIDDSPEAATDKSALEAAYNAAVATDALDRNKRGGVSTLIRMMMHAVGHRWAVFEIIWNPTGADLTAEFRFVPLQFFENTLGRLRFLASEGAYQGEDLEEGGWMVVCGPGLMLGTSIAYFLKRAPLQAWAILSDKFAVPYLHGETTAAHGSTEWNDFRDALAAFASDGAIVTSPGAKITPIQITGVEAPSQTLVDRMDRGITRIWRGADLGTMSKDGGAIGSNPQESETDILSAADALMISETLNYYFDAPLIQARYGRSPKAFFKLKPRTKLNQELQLKVDTALIGWGVPIGKKDLMERYGRAEPDTGDDIATAPAAPAQPGLAALANEGRDPNMVAFLARSVAQATKAEAAVLMPILKRLAAIETIEDPQAATAAIEAFRADWPQLRKEAIAQIPQLAAKLADIDATAFAGGVIDAAQARQTPVSKP